MRATQVKAENGQSAVNKLLGVISKLRRDHPTGKIEVSITYQNGKPHTFKIFRDYAPPQLESTLHKLERDGFFGEVRLVLEDAQTTEFSGHRTYKVADL